MNNQPNKHDEITGVILAGGMANRMGKADKGLIKFRGKPLIEYALDILTPQVSTILISANRNIDEYRKYGYPVVTDTMPGYFGPLAGIVSAMLVSENDLLLSIPCDCPLLPGTLSELMVESLTSKATEICVAHDGKFIQPAISLQRCSLVSNLQGYLESGQRKAAGWIISRNYSTVDFSTNPDLFANLNTMEDLAKIDND